MWTCIIPCKCFCLRTKRCWRVLIKASSVSWFEFISAFAWQAPGLICMKSTCSAFLVLLFFSSSRLEMDRFLSYSHYNVADLKVTRLLQFQLKTCKRHQNQLQRISGCTRDRPLFVGVARISRFWSLRLWS